MVVPERLHAAATGLAAFIAACGGSSTSSPGAAGGTGAAAGTPTSGSSDLAIVNYALTLEYLEAQSKEILAAALAIHTVEARHAATLNLVLKMSPTPDGAFAKPMTMDQVLGVVEVVA